MKMPHFKIPHNLMPEIYIPLKTVKSVETAFRKYSQIVLKTWPIITVSLPILAYICAYLYEDAFCNKLLIPSSLIKISWERFAAVSFKVLLMYLFVIVGTVVILTSIYLIIRAYAWLRIRNSDTRSKKVSEIKGGFINSWKFWPIIFLIIIVPYSLSTFHFFGNADAERPQDLYSVNISGTQLLVLRTYGDNLICASFNASNNQVLTDRYIVKQDGVILSPVCGQHSWIILPSCPLSDTEIKSIDFSSSSSSPTPTLTSTPDSTTSAQ